MRIAMGPTVRCWWIPRVVAQRAMIYKGPRPVVGNDVYVGPLSVRLGALCRWLGRAVEYC